MDEKQIKKIMKILTEWNPLGGKANSVHDLNNYRTEAIDILFHSGLFKINGKTEVIKLVQDILNQAFELSLGIEECKVPGKKIYNVLKKLSFPDSNN